MGYDMETPEGRLEPTTPAVPNRLETQASRIIHYTISLSVRGSFNQIYIVIVKPLVQPRVLHCACLLFHGVVCSSVISLAS